MMNKIISLIKVDFNNTFGLSSLIYNFKNKKNRWQSIILGFAMLSLIPTYIIMINSLVSIYDAYIELGQRSYFLQMGIFAAQLFVLLFGILYVMSKYYFSNDLEQLLPLPIKPSHILGSKFTILMISEYLTSFPIILPFIFIYGIKGGEGIIYWIYSLFIILGLPVIPLIISSTLVMIFMKYTNIKGKKDLLRVVGGIAFLIIVFYLQFKFQNMAQSSLMAGEDFAMQLARDSNLLVKKLGLIFPPSMWATLSLVNYSNFTGISYLLLLFVLSLVSYVIMINLSEKLFFSGLIGNMEATSSKTSQRSWKNIGRTLNKEKPYIAIAKKEIRILIRTPVYVLNSLVGVIIFPIIIILNIITGDNTMDPLIQVIGNHPEYLVLASIGLISIFGIMNSIGSTTFSREGKSLWIQRTLPIKVEDQIIGRILSSLLVQVVGLLALLIGIFFIARPRIIDIVIISVLGLLGSIPMTQIGMVIDILRPLLIWDNPQKAMKQNLNVLISMGLGTLSVGALFLLTKSLLGLIDIGYIYFILGSVFLVSAYVLFNILKNLIRRQFINLE